MQLTQYYAQFFTATILEWKPLLTEDKYKDIIIESLRFLAKEKRVVVYAFVIMSNHIHLVWQIQAGHTKENVQRDFLKFTGQMMKYDQNPVKAGLCNLAETYKYSSAKFYETGKDDFGFTEHVRG